MSDCRVPMPTYEPIGEVVDELKRKVDELCAEVEAKDARIRELEDERRIWLDGWAVNRITELEALVRYMEPWIDGAVHKLVIRRMDALGIEVDA